jgi:hypothetical protein
MNLVNFSLAIAVIFTSTIATADTYEEVEGFKIFPAEVEFMDVIHEFSIKNIKSDCTQHPVGMVSFDVRWLDDNNTTVEDRFYFDPRTLPMQCFEWSEKSPSTITALGFSDHSYLAEDNGMASELLFSAARVAERIVIPQ